MPVLIGTNRDEFTLFVALQYLRLGAIYTAEQYPELLRDTFGANAAAVGERYPPSNYGGNVALGVLGGRHRRGVLVRRRADERRPRQSRAGVRLRVQRPRRACARGDAHVAVSRRREPLAGAALHLRGRRRASRWIRRSRNCRTRCSTTGADSSPTGHRRRSVSPSWPALGADVAAQQWMSLQPDGSRVVTTFDESHQCPFWAGLPDERRRSADSDVSRLMTRRWPPAEGTSLRRRSTRDRGRRGPACRRPFPRRCSAAPSRAVTVRRRSRR